MTTKVQSVTGNGATLTLNGFAAGNALFLIDSYFRNTSTGVAEAIPTDTNGTFVASSADVPFTLNATDVGVGIFHQQNAASGTHTVTPQANSFHNTTLVEFSGLLTSGLSDVAKSAGTAGFAGTSQVTGTTATTTQADELVIIALGLAAATGVANVGLTDPVSGYLTLQLVQDDSTTVATQHAYRVISATGTQSATFNWTDTEASQFCMGCIATFKATSSAPDNLNISSARGHRGPTSGPRMRRMIPQRYQDDVLVTAVPPAIAPFRMGRGRGVGMPMRRMIPQRYPDAIATTTTTLSPLEGAITIAGAVASITLTIAAVAGAIVIGGNAPSVTTTLAPSVGAVVISGNAPSLTTTIAASTGAVTIGGNAPTLTSTLAPSEAAVVISGNVPDIPGGPITPTEGAIVIDGNVPDITTVSVDQTSASNWQANYWKHRTKKDRKTEEDRQRIELGILPPELEIVAEQAISEAVAASTELAAGRVDAASALGVAMQARQEYDNAYKQAYKDAYVSEVVAELWKEDIKRAQRRRAIALLLLT